jgi:putative membrane protein
MQRIMTLAGLIALSLGVGLAPTVVAKNTKQAGLSDQTFVQKASSGGLAEVRAGQLATERAASAEVKQFGQQMVTDHTKANQELTTLAQAKHLPVATELDQKHQALAEKLATLQGAAFDRAYLAGQVADHAQTVRLFTTEAREGHDAELKAFAAQTLPTLQEHLRMVRALAPKQSGERAQPHSARAKKP